MLRCSVSRLSKNIVCVWLIACVSSEVARASEGRLGQKSVRPASARSAGLPF